MFRSILQTLSAKLIIALLQVGLLFITTRLMGATLKGEISLIILNLSIIAILGGTFGGPALGYLVPRFKLKNLLVINYIWSTITALVVTGIFMFLPSLEDVHLLFFLVLAVTEGIFSTNTIMLVGGRQLGRFNMAALCKTFLTVIILVGWYFAGYELTTAAFMWAYLAGLVCGLLIAAFGFRHITSTLPQSASWREAVQAGFKYGLVVQICNLAQMLNYRLSFLLLELFVAAPFSLVRIGIYSAVLQVGESVLQFSRSVSIVQYAEVSNLSSEEAGLRISLVLAKLNYVVTTVGMVVLILIPTDYYTAFLGNDFIEVREHLYYLSIGVISLSISGALSHYFSGIGLHRINMKTALLGLVLTIVLGVPGIYYFGTIGAAAVATVVYLFQTIYQFQQLKQKMDVQWSALLITHSDVQMGRKIFGRIFGGKGA